MLTHLRNSFIDPMVNELSDPEAELKAWDWSVVFLGDGRQALTKLNAFWAIVSRLAPSRRASSQHTDH